MRWRRPLDDFSDVAAVFFRYLNNLPEPVIPYADFERFLQPLEPYQHTLLSNIAKGKARSNILKRISGQYFELINNLASPNRSLLLYILDIISLFPADPDLPGVDPMIRSDINSSRSNSLATTFEALLGPPSQPETPRYWELLKLAHFVISFLINYRKFFVTDHDYIRSIDADTAKLGLAVGAESFSLTDNRTANLNSQSRLSGIDVELNASGDSGPTTTTNAVQHSAMDESGRGDTLNTASIHSDSNLMRSEDSKLVPLMKSSLVIQDDDYNAVTSSFRTHAIMNLTAPFDHSLDLIPQGYPELRGSQGVNGKAENPAAEGKHNSTSAEALLTKDRDTTLKPKKEWSIAPFQSMNDKTNPQPDQVAEISQIQTVDSIFQLHQERVYVFTEAEISTIAQFLRGTSPSWSVIPRVYVILRVIGCLDSCETIFKSGFSDYELPVSRRHVPKQLSSKACS